MAYYTIKKRFRKNTPVFCASVIKKRHGKIVFSKSKTLTTKSNAVKWAKALVSQIEIEDIQSLSGLREVTLGELIREYIKNKSESNRPLGRTAMYSYKTVLKYPISKIVASKIRSHDIVEFCSQRKVSEFNPTAATISIDVSLIRKVLRVGKPLLGVQCSEQAVIDSYQPLYDLKLIGKSKARDRRLEGNEYRLLEQTLVATEAHHCSQIPYVDILQVSILTCLRISEITSLRWRDLDANRKVIIVRDRKSPSGSEGNHNTIPLLGGSLELLAAQPKLCEFIFPFNSRSITAGFRRACKKIGIKDLRYHDLRREGASRLMELGFSIEEVATVTGHRNLGVLWQVYTKITPEHLLEKEKLNISK